MSGFPSHRFNFGPMSNAELSSGSYPECGETSMAADPEEADRDDKPYLHSVPLTPELQAISLDYDLQSHAPATHRQPSSHSMGKIKLPEQRDIIMTEVGPAIETQPDYVSTLYRNLVSERQLAQCVAAFMSKGHWKGIPRKPGGESKLYEPLVLLINSLLNMLLVSCDAKKGLNRQAVNTSNVYIKHKEKGISSKPDIVIQASGSSFEGGYYAKDPVAWANVASIFDAKLQEKMCEIRAHLKQLASYVRQIFIAQPNRIFVRCLLLSESHARLVHFDRSGCEYSPLFNYHKIPLIFLRLVVGLSSTDERDLGFDTTIKWTVTKGVKLSGSLTVVGRDRKPVEYILASIQPFFQRDSVCGRGTRCYLAVDPNDPSNRVVIKDSWCSQYRRQERVLLEKAQGLPGVCQLLDYDTTLSNSSTRDFRCVSSIGTVHHRTHSRIVMKAYGPTVEHFKSPVQAISAIRDAISAHRSLFGRRILHRDISNSNIFLGFDDTIGHRGTLSDLDMAIEIGTPSNEEYLDVESGTRFFQSNNVLESYWKDAPAQDYLDDLESFLYLLCFLFVLFHGTGGMKPASNPAHAVHEPWTTCKPANASDLKHRFLTSQNSMVQKVLANIDDNWGAPARDLLLQFRSFIAGVTWAKDPLAADDATRPTDESGRPFHRYTALHENVANDYKQIIKMFDDAISKYEESGQKNTPPVFPTTGSAIPPGALPTTGKKRRGHGEHTVAPTAKRLKKGGK